MSKATQDEKREAKRENYVEQVFLLSGLPGWPFEDAGKTALVDCLMRETASLEHAHRVIAKALVSMFPRKGSPESCCPTPLELTNLCRATPADPSELPGGCARCLGNPWVYRVDRDDPGLGGVVRCSCERGRRLAEMDAARERRKSMVPQ